MPDTELESWSRALPLAARGLIPFRQLVPGPGTPWIRALRAMSIVFGMSLVLIVLILLPLHQANDQSKQWPIWLWAATSLASVTGFAISRPMRSRGVIAAPDLSVAVLKYRERLMLSIALAQVPTLVAFMVFFAAETLTPYLVSLPVSLALLSWASPREADISRLQEAIADRGGSVDLIVGLMEAPDWRAVRSRRRKGRRGES